MVSTGGDDAETDDLAEVLARSFGSSTLRITGPDGYIELRPLRELDLDDGE